MRAMESVLSLWLVGEGYFQVHTTRVDSPLFLKHQLNLRMDHITSTHLNEVSKYSFQPCDYLQYSVVVS